MSAKENAEVMLEIFSAIERRDAQRVLTSAMPRSSFTGRHRCLTVALHAV
jgi:hypothetical protein